MSFKNQNMLLLTIHKYSVKIKFIVLRYNFLININICFYFSFRGLAEFVKSLNRWMLFSGDFTQLKCNFCTSSCIVSSAA